MILTNRVLTVNGDKASLDSAIYLYRGDRNIELYFSVINSRYRFTKNSSDNIIESTEAVYSIFKVVSPNGEELVFPVTPIENGMAKWVIEGSLIDELDEVGKYDLQIRLLDDTQKSIITMPPIIGQVEVLSPLFGDINALAGVDATGKARTSVLNATQRPTLNSDGTYNKKNWVKQEIIFETDLNTLEDITSKNCQSILDIEKGIKGVSETLTGDHLTSNGTVEGNITDLEILGNTVQDASNLANIQSVGTLREDGLFEISILSCGKNLFEGEYENKAVNGITGEVTPNLTRLTNKKSIKCKRNVSYTLKVEGGQALIRQAYYYKLDGTYIGAIPGGDFSKSFTFSPTEDVLVLWVLKNQDDSNITVSGLTTQLEEGTQATTYEPYQGNSASILLPCPLEKVGTVSDRLFRREDGVWCVEKWVNRRTLKSTDNFGDWGLILNSKYRVIALSEDLILNKLSTNILCSSYIAKPYNIFVDNGDYISVNVSNGYTMFIVTAITLSNFKQSLNSFPIELVYIAKTPQIIELPLDTQIQLNSFNGVTNIFTEDTIIEPTIKATVPKSLGASVNSLVNKTSNLNQQIIRIARYILAGNVQSLAYELYPEDFSKEGLAE